MSETSVSIKCEACNGNFDDEKKIPMILACGHKMCYECIQNFYLNAGQIKCVKDGCKEITQVHPSKIKTDEGLLFSYKQSSLQNDLNTLKNLEKELSQQILNLKKVKREILNKFLQNLEQQLLASSSDVQKNIQSMLLVIKKKISALMEIQDQMKSQSLQSDLARQEQNKIIENGQSMLQKAQQEYSKLANYNLNSFQQKIDYKSKKQKYQRQIQQLQEYIKEQTSQLQELQFQLLKSQNKVIKERDQLKQSILTQQQDQENQFLSYQKQVQDLQKEIDQLMQQQSQQSQVLQQYQKQNQNQEFSITIVSPNKKTLQLQVKQDTTIGQIKEQIHQKTQLEPSQLDLLKSNYFFKTILKDGQTIVYNNLVNGDQLQMELSNEGKNATC